MWTCRQSWGWIFNEHRLPYKNKGGEDGLLTVCAQLGIPLAGGQRTAALLREKVYAYHSAVRTGASPSAGLAAAAEITAARMVQKPSHPPAPPDVNLNGTNLFFMLFTEAPPLLALLRHMMVRDKPESSPSHVALHGGGGVGCHAATCHDCRAKQCAVDCRLAVCVCTHRHRVLVLSKLCCTECFCVGNNITRPVSPASCSYSHSSFVTPNLYSSTCVLNTFG